MHKTNIGLGTHLNNSFGGDWGSFRSVRFIGLNLNRTSEHASEASESDKPSVIEFETKDAQGALERLAAQTSGRAAEQLLEIRDQTAESLGLSLVEDEADKTAKSPGIELVEDESDDSNQTEFDFPEQAAAA